MSNNYVHLMSERKRFSESIKLAMSAIENGKPKEAFICLVDNKDLVWNIAQKKVNQKRLQKELF